MHTYRFNCILVISLLVLIVLLTNRICDGLQRSPFDSIENSEDSELIVDEEDEEQASGNKFSWKDHQDDHGIYAHRSLMSTANIRHHSEEDETNSENDSTASKASKSRLGDDEDPIKTVDYAEKEWQLMFRAFDLAYDSMSTSILQQLGKQTNLFDEIVSRLKPECKRDIYHIRESVKKHRLWALRMLDSNGKIPSGITYGKFSSPGDYEECLSVRVDELVQAGSPGANGGGSIEQYQFRGKYCLLDFRLPMPERPKDKLLSIHEPVLDLSDTELGRQFPAMKNYSSYASVFYEVGYMHAFCLPSSCDVHDVTKSVGIALEGLHIIVNNTVDCEVKSDEPKPLRTSQLISLSFLVLLFLNASLASVAHHFLSKSNRRTESKHQDEDRGRKGRVLLNSPVDHVKHRLTRLIKRHSFYTNCFSIQKNFERLTKPDPRGLTFVHYTRIVAMGLTVVTHTAGLGTLQAITKPADASNSEQIFRDFIPQMLANAFTSIQIFFFMAGFMLVISTYPSIKRERGHMSFVEYAIKRAIRLMPGIAATICLNFLWPLVVDGPMLSYFVRAIVLPCESTWWRTMSFLSNFDHVEKMCLRHSYFSASDYQLHIMAFPLLLLLYKHPTLSLFLAALLTVGGFVAQVIMVLTKTLLPFMMVDYIDKEAFFNVVHYIHHPVWNHMSAFFYGFIIGYFVVKKMRIDLSEKTIKRIWLVIMPAGIVSIFAPYFWNHYKRPIYKWQMVLYVLIDRFVLLTTCAWLSYASMVLAVKPRPKGRDTSRAELPKPQLNLPEIVTLDQQDKEKAASVENSRLRPSSSASSIPRQRSSPNLMQVELGNGAARIRPASSTVDVSSPANDNDQFAKSKTGVESGPLSGDDPKTLVEQQAGRRTQGPISNVNTLCLILSRLTFQLYLFNMVVLWVDVNHSKYYWFFSYYFIITKAFAVYICSSLIAMVFFVTLESPSLTLYIMWVKSRAEARANKSTEKNEKQDYGCSDNKPTGIDLSPNEDRTSPGSPNNKSNASGSFDGICMRSGTPDATVKPTFSFIDLSMPTNSGPELDDKDSSVARVSNGTRM